MNWSFFLSHYNPISFTIVIIFIALTIFCLIEDIKVKRRREIKSPNNMWMYESMLEEMELYIIKIISFALDFSWNLFYWNTATKICEMTLDNSHSCYERRKKTSIHISFSLKLKWLKLICFFCIFYSENLNYTFHVFVYSSKHANNK